MRLKNKKAFVTAAGQGIGKAIAEKFFHFGSEVLAVDINDAMLTQLRVTQSLCLDVRDAEAILTAIKDFEPDILINCAGIAGPTASLEDIDPGDWDQTIRVNLNGMFYCLKEAIPLLKNSEQENFLIFNNDTIWNENYHEEINNMKNFYFENNIK